MIDTLDRSHSTDRHEDRRFYLSVVSGDDAASGRGIRGIMCLYEFHLLYFNLQR
jgi:hypothetical protein